MSDAEARCDRHIKALMEQYAALRGERREAEARQHIGVPQGELEVSLPAGVPLHKRGFGVMDEEGE